MESHTAGLVSSKETTVLNGGTETEQTKNITFCNLHQGEDFIQMTMVLIGLGVDIEMIV